jgi:hypothetical protein
MLLQSVQTIEKNNSHIASDSASRKIDLFILDNYSKSVPMDVCMYLGGARWKASNGVPQGAMASPQHVSRLSRRLSANRIVF